MYHSLHVLVTSNDHHRGVSTPRYFLNYPKVKPVPVDTVPATGAVSQVTGTVRQRDTCGVTRDEP